MSDELDARGAAATGMLGGDEETYRSLLQSIVDVARTIFAAEAASIFLFDEDADELVFEAVSGQGGDTLIGTRFPSSSGIAGFALVTRQPLVVDDLGSDPRFSSERAATTGYVPSSIVASPLLHDERALGVLSVLDRARGSPVRGRRARASRTVLDTGGDRARPAAPCAARARGAGRGGQRGARRAHRLAPRRLGRRRRDGTARGDRARPRRPAAPRNGNGAEAPFPNRAGPPREGRPACRLRRSSTFSTTTGRLEPMALEVVVLALGALDLIVDGLDLVGLDLVGLELVRLELLPLLLFALVRHGCLLSRCRGRLSHSPDARAG